MSELLDLELRQAVDWIAQGRTSASELLSEAIASVERLDHVTNAVIGMSPDRARAEAARLDRVPVVDRGPLHGVPLAHKDMFYRKGEISSWGSKQLAGQVMHRTAELLTRLDAAGSISFARLNMAQFAMGPTGENPDFGRCRTPLAPNRISGGSSSGSGAAVAARFAFAALGSDTGGSVRLPAALCGVVGLKPTQGLLPMAGVMGLSESLDAPGPIARASGDIARLMDVMTVTRRHEGPLDEAVAGVRIGIPTSYYCDDLEPEIAASFEAAISTYGRLGAEMVPVDLPDHRPYADLADLIWKPEAAALHLVGLQESTGHVAPQARARLLQGFATSAVDYVRARTARSAELYMMLEGPLAACDAILTPAMRITAPLAADVHATGGERMRKILEAITAFTRPLNFLGLPGLVTPAGQASSGAPLAIQLIGRPREEPLLLRLSHQFERHTGFNRLRPSMLA